MMRTSLKLALSLSLGFSILAAPLPAAAQSVDQRISDYRTRVERLEDHAAIENLTANFGYYFDKGLWGEAASLFTANARFEYGQRGVYIGKKRIERSMLMFGPEGLASGHLNNHMMLQNIIIVADDGRTATGRWQGPVQLSTPGANGIWGVGIYENTYAKEGGIWKLSSVHFYPAAFTDYDAGFMRSQLPMEGQNAVFPPDEPPTEVYRTLPSNYIPPFSYDHPVTGKSLKDIVQPKDDLAGRE